MSGMALIYMWSFVMGTALVTAGIIVRFRVILAIGVFISSQVVFRMLWEIWRAVVE